MTVSEEQLSAFADGALSAEECARVAQAVSADPALAARVARMRHAAATLRGAFGAFLEEPVSARHTALFESIPQGGARTLSFPLRSRPQALWLGAAAAACLGFAFLGGRMSAPNSETPLIAQSPAGLRAAGALAQALDHQASGPAADQSVQIALSFPSEKHGYCRVFRIEGASAEAVAGLACGGARDWAVVALAESAPTDAGAGYGQASGEIPAVIRAAAAARQSADALDAEAEAAVLRNRWRAAAP